tara:strand:- start:10 stop:261 length:252 start_codon:yes stop_codon:yes gene_type:complete
MSNEYLNETQTWGEAINEWLITEEPVVSVSEYYTVDYTVDSAGEATILAIRDSQDTILWENTLRWTEAEDKLISEILLWGQLV